MKLRACGHVPAKERSNRKDWQLLSNAMLVRCIPSCFTWSLHKSAFSLPIFVIPLVTPQCEEYIFQPTLLITCSHQKIKYPGIVRFWLLFADNHFGLLFFLLNSIHCPKCLQVWSTNLVMVMVSIRKGRHWGVERSFAFVKSALTVQSHEVFNSKSEKCRLQLMRRHQCVLEQAAELPCSKLWRMAVRDFLYCHNRNLENFVILQGLFFLLFVILNLRKAILHMFQGFKTIPHLSMDLPSFVLQEIRTAGVVFVVHTPTRYFILFKLHFSNQPSTTYGHITSIILVVLE